MKLLINKGCIGCGSCEGICPSVFLINADGRAEIDRQPDKSELDKVKDAIEMCPAKVIELYND